MKYVIVIERTDTGFSAYVPDLPGCISVGNTRSEVEGYMQESIMLHIEGLKEDGEEIPNPTTETITMDIPNLA